MSTRADRKALIRQCAEVEKSSSRDVKKANMGRTGWKLSERDAIRSLLRFVDSESATPLAQPGESSVIVSYSIYFIVFSCTSCLPSRRRRPIWTTVNLRCATLARVVYGGLPGTASEGGRWRTSETGWQTLIAEHWSHQNVGPENGTLVGNAAICLDQM